MRFTESLRSEWSASESRREESLRALKSPGRQLLGADGLVKSFIADSCPVDSPVVWKAVEDLEDIQIVWIDGNTGRHCFAKPKVLSCIEDPAFFF